MAWTIKLGDTSVSVEDLPLKEFEQITREFDVNWYHLFASPGAYPSAFWRVVCLAADRAGVPRPTEPETIGDIVGLIDMLEMGDDRPTTWDDGRPTEDGQETN